MKLKGGHWVLVTLKSLYGTIPGNVVIGVIKDEPEPIGKREQIRVIVKTSTSWMTDEIVTVRYKPKERFDLHRMKGWKHRNFFMTWIDNGYVLGQSGLIDMHMKERMESMETYVEALEKTKEELADILKKEGVMEMVQRELDKLDLVTSYMRKINENLSPMDELSKLANIKKVLDPNKVPKK